MLVVRARLTRRDAARRAVRALRSVGANIAGFVMNAVPIAGGTYSYRYYGSDDAPAKSA